MAYKGIRAGVLSIARQRTIPAVVIDVLGSRCTVRLSGRGSILTGITFSGKTPKVGDNVSVDYSRGNPVAITSDDSGNKVAPLESTGKPIVRAVSVPSSGALEVVDKGVPWASVIGAPVKVTEDLTTQIDGIGSHFAIEYVALQKCVVSCNIEQQPTSILMDNDMHGFTLTFTPTVRDVLLAEYSHL
jgi:hypothetical protein